jgi:hypothetical protein
MGVVRGARANRASRTLLVYTTGCARAEINLGKTPGDQFGFVTSTISPRSINAEKITTTSVLLNSYLASFTIHNC